MTDFLLDRLPETDDELYWTVKALWGVTIPRHHVCPDHVAPFTAFADAYFARNSVLPGSPVDSMALWHGSRGLSGKSYMLSILGITEAFLLGTKINLLGGSLNQSTTIHEHMREALYSKNSPRWMIEHEGTSQIRLTNGAKIKPLTASQRTVRGPHPSRILLDEIDEMDLSILDAALGQPMTQMSYTGEWIKPFTVMCSTWQNPDGCMHVNTPIMTQRGEIPIQEVVVGDLVPTRNGWKTVTASINTGRQETVTVELASGKRLTCTPWHPFWTDKGWVKASLLPVGAHVLSVVTGVSGLEGCGARTDALSTSPSISSSALFGTRQRQVMPVVADSLFCAEGDSSSVVLLDRDGLKVTRVDASSVATEMVKMQISDKGSVDFDPDPSVGQHDPLLKTSVGLVPVAVTSNSERPNDAVVSVEVDGYVFADDEVVNVIHTGIILPTWDLTVDDTHEYVANGILVHNTFTEIMKRAEENQIPTYAWCFRDTANPIDGWLTQEAIEEKRRSIPAEMWRVEYELGEPSIGNRAFDTEYVDRTFSWDIEPIREKVHKDFEEVVFEEPIADVPYVAAADWAKEQDYTVITVARVDKMPHEVVYYIRLNRRPYPSMIRYFHQAMANYRASAIHDATGLGNVINDLMEEVGLPARKFLMVGAKRQDMLSEFVSAIESDRWRIPRRLRTAYSEMKYCRVGDLYSSAQEYHLPDTVCAFALMEYQTKRQFTAASPIVVRKDERHINKYQQMFEPHQAYYENPDNNGRVSGVVSQLPEEQSAYTFSI